MRVASAEAMNASFWPPVRMEARAVFDCVAPSSLFFTLPATAVPPRFLSPGSCPARLSWLCLDIRAARLERNFAAFGRFDLGRPRRPCEPGNIAEGAENFEPVSGAEETEIPPTLRGIAPRWIGFTVPTCGWLSACGPRLKAGWAAPEAGLSDQTAAATGATISSITAASTG